MAPAKPREMTFPFNSPTIPHSDGGAGPPGEHGGLRRAAVAPVQPEVPHRGRERRARAEDQGAVLRMELPSRCGL